MAIPCNTSPSQNFRIVLRLPILSSLHPVTQDSVSQIPLICSLDSTINVTSVVQAFPMVYSVFHNSFSLCSLPPVSSSKSHLVIFLELFQWHSLVYNIKSKLAWVADGCQVLLYLRPPALQTPHSLLSSPSADTLWYYTCVTNLAASLNLCTCYSTQRMIISWMFFITECKHLFLLIDFLSFSLFQNCSSRGHFRLLTEKSTVPRPHRKFQKASTMSILFNTL